MIDLRRAVVAFMLVAAASAAMAQGAMAQGALAQERPGRGGAERPNRPEQAQPTGPGVRIFQGRCKECLGKGRVANG